MKSISSYPLFQTQLFVGVTVNHFSLFLSHSSFSKCQHFAKNLQVLIVAEE